jgi:hypothetical protein
LDFESATRVYTRYVDEIWRDNNCSFTLGGAISVIYDTRTIRGREELFVSSNGYNQGLEDVKNLLKGSEKSVDLEVRFLLYPTESTCSVGQGSRKRVDTPNL